MFSGVKHNKKYIKIISSQEQVITQCIKLLPEFNVITLIGDQSSGKHTIVKEITYRTQSQFETFDFTQLSKNSDSSYQNIHNYLKNILTKLNTKLNFKQYNKQNFKQKIEGSVEQSIEENEMKNEMEENVEECVDRNEIKNKMENEMENEMEETGRRLCNLELSEARLRGIIYFRNYEKIYKVYPLLSDILKSFSETMPKNISIFITTNDVDILKSYNYFEIDIDITKYDIQQIIKNFIQLHSINLSQDVIQNMINISKCFSIGTIIHCLKYAYSLSDKYQNILELYKKELTRLTNNNYLDICELIGMEDIFQELNTSIIIPLRLKIPMKKYILLLGPKYTGKTSIGIWLTQQIDENLFFLNTIDNPIQELKRIISKRNNRMVIFIDTVDIYFQNKNIYREFLDILDKSSNDICIIMTSNQINKIPSTLIKGYIEEILYTKLPDRKKLHLFLDKALKLYTLWQEQLTTEIKLNLSLKMTGWNYNNIKQTLENTYRSMLSRNKPLIETLEYSIKKMSEHIKLCNNLTDQEEFRSQQYIN